MTQNLDVPLTMAELASGAGMSVTSLHRHFKSATGTTPLIYYKRLRLHEARRQSIAESLSVTQAAAAVGYASVAHFSRDYKRMFGRSPLHDFSALRKSN
ncbi:helix-turn-helix domain-containing protein [Amycolatopsis sp. H20-H5]|uniref:helix-turn-helix domain-containing protein n=1 Tax=Amycolatopsis sp. H20-H5 TaxID=3046309 RepID=UPI003FA36669